MPGMQSAQEVFAVVSIQHHDLYLQGQSSRQSGGVFKPLIPRLLRRLDPTLRVPNSGCAG